jgi:hypothetical protein
LPSRPRALLVCSSCSARDEVVRSILLLALLDQSPLKSNHARCCRAVEFSVDTLSSTARLISSKQATFSTALARSASRAIYNCCRHKHWYNARLETAIVAMHIRVNVQHQLRPRHWLHYVRLSPLQTKNSQMEVLHESLLGLLCSDRFRYEIPLNVYCFCTNYTSKIEHQSHG